MKAYLGIKYHEDHSNKDKIDKISSMIEKYGYSVSCITRDVEHWGEFAFNPHELMNKTFQIINESNVVIIDLSEKGVGLGIEAGYAFAKNKPVIVIADNTESSTTMMGITKHNFIYKADEDLDAFLQSVLIRT